jgi:transposase-like protein
MRHLTPAEKAEILARVEDGEPITRIAEDLGRPRQTIYRFLLSMRDTTALARRVFRAGAYQLAERVVQHATVDQALDVLARPGIEVIAPAPASPKAGSPSVLVSVSAEACGAVLVGVADQTPATPASPAAPERRALAAPDPVHQALATAWAELPADAREPERDAADPAPRPLPPPAPVPTFPPRRR